MGKRWAWAVLCVIAANFQGSWSGDVAKKVLHTPWWPAGSETTAESVGIVSHGFVYMTAMMEVNRTLDLTMEAIVSDVNDIAEAGDTDIGHLVDCIVNAPRGRSGAARLAFERALERGSSGAAAPTLTVVEMPGEYKFTPFSASCVAAVGPESPVSVRTAKASGSSARGLLHATAEAAKASEALAAVEALAIQAGASLDGLVDCTAFVRDHRGATAVRAALSTLPAAPATTVVEAVGFANPLHAVALRCVVAVSQELDVLRYPGVVSTGGLVFASGITDQAQPLGSGALADLERTLKPLGVGLSDVINCLFVVRNQSQVFELFQTFYQVFNKDHPPPPTRGEFQGASECTDCALQAKCIAALPVTKLLGAISAPAAQASGSSQTRSSSAVLSPVPELVV